MTPLDTEFEIWIARCRPGPDQTEQPTAAVWAMSAADCEQTLRNKILERGLEWIGLEDARPLQTIPAEETADLPTEGLGSALGPDQPVIFRRGQFRKRKTAQHITTPLPFSAPLDAQFGKHPRLNVPDDLAPHLFPNDGRKTYAILDAGQFRALPSLLSSAGLTHRSLYKGQLGQQAAGIAPYLVQLDATSSLTRHLMTKGCGPKDMWSQDYGVFVLSALGFDALYAHFRKFTFIEDSTGNDRVFLRFWSGAVMRAFSGHTEPDPLISNLLTPCTLIYRDLHRTGDPVVLSLALEAPT